MASYPSEPERYVMELKSFYRWLQVYLLPAVLIMIAWQGTALAREIEYTGNEVQVYVNPGEPTQITFPGKIAGGFVRQNSQVSLKREGNFIVVFAQPGLAPTGEVIILHLEDERSYSIRILPAGIEQSRDDSVKISDKREPEIQVEVPKAPREEEFPTAPPSVVSGLMREMVLVAELGKRGIPGYRRSNRFSGEVILQDGAVEAVVDEIFMGPDLWGYVITVNNLLETTQRLNPATFRVDGTRAISAERWELAPRPRTAEQKISNEHQAKLYLITRSKRF